MHAVLSINLCPFCRGVTHANEWLTFVHKRTNQPMRGNKGSIPVLILLPTLQAPCSWYYFHREFLGAQDMNFLILSRCFLSTIGSKRNVVNEVSWKWDILSLFVVVADAIVVVVVAVTIWVIREVVVEDESVGGNKRTVFGEVHVNVFHVYGT